jgi:hypothetical protein
MSKTASITGMEIPRMFMNKTENSFVCNHNSAEPDGEAWMNNHAAPL